MAYSQSLAVMLKKQVRHFDNVIKDRNEMTELIVKITRSFPFLKNSANPHVAHCQAAQTDTQTEACQRVAIFPLVNTKLFINLIFTN